MTDAARTAERSNNLGRSLREWREKLGRSIRDFADEMNVSNNTLGSYERGEGALPDFEFLSLFASKTGVDFMELVKLRLESSDSAAAQMAALQVPLPVRDHTPEQHFADIEASAYIPEPGAVRYDRKFLMDCVKALENELDTLGRRMTGHNKASAITMLYEISIAKAAVDEHMLDELIGLLSAPIPAAPAIDGARLTAEIVSVIDEWLAETKRTLSPDAKGEVASILYDIAKEGDGARSTPLDRAAVRRLLRLVA